MNIIFLCTHNACRSILAEAIAQKFLGKEHEIRSAGSAPRGVIHPVAINYLNQQGYDTSKLSSKSLEDLHDFKADYIITLCDSAANEPCPALFSKTPRLHWGFEDPSKTHDTKLQQERIHSLKARIEKELTALTEKAV